jgi:hypothetical protein
VTTEIARFLRTAGVDACYGAPLPGVAIIPAPPRVAELLAAAHERVHAARAAVHRGDGIITIGAGPAAALGVPVDGPFPELAPPERWLEPETTVVDALRAASNPMLLAGAGVHFDRAVPGLHALAAAGSLGVVNTFTAKGVFDWRSRHHFATAGLQSRDFSLSGLADADLIVTTGVDADDVRAEEWWLAPTVAVPPLALDPLADVWSRRRTELVYPELRSMLFPVTQAGWVRAAAPLAPTRVTRAYATTLAGGGIIAADPGTAGYWVARTFTTTQPGVALLPSAGDTHGFAAACAVVARVARPDRPVLAVVDGPERDEVHAVLEWARAIGVEIAVEAWSDDGAALDADAHQSRLGGLVANGGIVTLATDPAPLDEMVALAGPITAWTAPTAHRSPTREEPVR